MITEHKRKNGFTKSTLKNKLSALRKISFFSKQKLLADEIGKEKINPISPKWNNILKPKLLQIESDYLKTKGLEYIQISTIK
jgi:hypothetical protein